MLVYSAAAVRRMLGLTDDAIVEVREFFKVIWVWVKGSRPRFISKQAFKQHFVDRRKAEAKVLTVQKAFMPNTFHVLNKKSRTEYTIQCFTGGIICNCEDFRNQSQFFGRACCKHGYAVLELLGFGSLQNYINALGPSGYLRSKAA